MTEHGSLVGHLASSRATLLCSPRASTFCQSVRTQSFAKRGSSSRSRCLQSLINIGASIV
ncbi:hypothetical protein A2U01_0067972, partial [Trifolium medium]|nr:hypothetical protein [Trifolium medium]